MDLTNDQLHFLALLQQHGLLCSLELEGHIKDAADQLTDLGVVRRVQGKASFIYAYPLNPFKDLQSKQN